MKPGALGVLVLAALAVLAGSPPPRVLAEDAPRDPVVAKVDDMLETIRNNKPSAGGGSERIYTFTEEEANAYIAARIAAENSRAERGGEPRTAVLESATVSFLPGRILEAQAVGRLEPGALKRWAPDLSFADALARWFASENKVRVRALLTSAKGKAFFRTEWARFNGHGVPEAWILAVTERVGRAQRPPVDFTRMFELPNGIDRVEIGFHFVRIRVRPGASRS